MSTVKAIQQNIKQEAGKIVTDLQALAEEIRLKAHLASADGRDAWKKLEPQLQQFERRVEHVTESAMGELRQAGKELQANLERICRETRKD
ncbi:MAG: hypothetical protein ABI895_15330 [Deltaproteobacteria bacterium]